MKIPTLPSQTKPAIWGAVVGAIGLAIVGFSWGGWVTGTTAEKLADTHAKAAVTSVLTPICVDQFQNSLNASANLVELKEIENSWKQRDYVSDGGWATMPGSTAKPSRNIADACATKLSQLDL